MPEANSKPVPSNLIQTQHFFFTLPESLSFRPSPPVAGEGRVRGRFARDLMSSYWLPHTRTMRLWRLQTETSRSSL